MSTDTTLSLEAFPLNSDDITKGKIQELLKLFPEARTESETIDFERLKMALGESVDVGRERYHLSWPGKSECFKTLQQTSTATLRPCIEESLHYGNTDNVIIEGDNLEVLKLLQKSYMSKISMIFIDPPYNTGGDFIYPDNFSESIETYLKYTGQVDLNGLRFGDNTETDGRFHSKWLNMIYPRLSLAKNLLRDDGVIFITIDDTELANLRKVMDEIFGEENFVAQVEWQKRYTRSNNTDNFTSVLDHICIYQKSDYFQVRLLPRGEEANARFTNPDNDVRGPWKATPFLNQVSPDKRPNLCYPITNPHTGKTVLPKAKAWRYEKNVFDRLLADNRLYWGKEGTRDVPDIKTFLHEVREGMTPINLWTHEYAGHTDLANREIKDLFDEKVFDTPKPSLLISRMLEHCPDSSAIVLDFFAGSGTTAHAVLDLNKKDGGSRKFILVQLPEPTGRIDYPTIADITKERVRRVVKKLNGEDAGKRPSLLEAPAAKQDRGFCVFKLDESNFTPWNADIPPDAEGLQKQLFDHVNHIRSGRTQEDILYELLLKSGFPLTTPVEKLTMADKAVYSVAGGAMFLCLERVLTMELIRAMADQKPERVVCLDEGFAGNDQLKANAVQIFKTKGVTKFQTV